MIIAVRESGVLPQTDTGSLFEVEGGKVLIHGVIGEVTEQLESVGLNLTTAVGSVPAGTSSGVGGAAPGLLYAGNASSGTVTAVSLAVAPIVAGDGIVISLTTSGSATGEMSWTVLYEQLDAGAQIVPV